MKVSQMTVSVVEQMKDNEFHARMNYFQSVASVKGYRTQWSIYEADDIEQRILENKTYQVRYQYVRNDATVEELNYDLQNGTQSSMAEVTSLAVDGTVEELWRAAESCVKQSGTHHTFIEDFEIQEDGTLLLVTGS